MKIFYMKALLSLLIASWTNESRETKPFGEISVLDVRLRRKDMIVSESYAPFVRLSKSPRPLLPLLS